MSRAIQINYCVLCGESVKFDIPPGDTLPRHICQNKSCGFVHYQNPKVVAACIVEWQNEILLCRRAIEPRSGLWTVPAGFMENGETVEHAAARETEEEACAKIESTDLFAVYSIPRVNQVYIIFRGQLSSPDYAPGEESLDVKLFAQDNIPWDELAFPVVREALKLYCNTPEIENFPVFLGHIE